MKCPYCQETETKVVDSRYSSSSDTIRRRRQCPKCNSRFTTRETLELSMPRVMKKDGSRCVFDEEKIRRGILRCCEKRSINSDQIDDVVCKIKDQIVARSEKDEITSLVIGDIVMNAMRNLDEVAYIRFASVYESFTSIESFQEAVNQLKEERDLICEEE